MKIGISTPLPAYKVNAAFMASTAENLGFESIWYAEHPVIPVESSSRFPGSDDGLIPWTYSHFADPYIAQRSTNLEQKKINNATMTKVSVKADESPEDFKIEIKKTNNEYKVSIKRLLDIIYENNIFREDFDEDGNPILQIEILTSLKREDIKKIKHNWSEHFININDKILFALSDTSRPNCKLELKIGDT